MPPRIPPWLVRLLPRPVAIFGAGLSGRAAAGLVRELGGQPRLFDERAPEAADRGFGEAEAHAHGLVVVSPGFPAAHPWLRVARSAGAEVLGELDLGALAWPGRVVAVTGTNGKTTLTEFLTHALRQSGADARAAGNIGAPLCDAWRVPATAESFAVCEVSSFQAESLRFFEAEATVWSNFAEDHLERHASLEEYFRAKFNLVKRTRGRAVFYDPSVGEGARRYGLELPVAGAVALAPAGTAVELEGTPFARAPQRENFLLARALWRHLGLPDEALVAAARTFVLGPHRQARVGEARGVTFWNDSKATNFHAVEAALAGVARPVLWIAGGRAKGGDLAAFSRRIAPRVQHAFLIGETREILARHLRACAVPVTLCATLREAVSRAYAAAVAGDHVVLSPAFASFDMFHGYEDRGRRFEALVAELTGGAAAGGASASSFPSLPTSLHPPAAAGICRP